MSRKKLTRASVPDEVTTTEACKIIIERTQRFISPGRVRTLLAEGVLEGHKRARDWLITVKSIENYCKVRNTYTKGKRKHTKYQNK